MSLLEIKERVEALSQCWEEFKQVNDRRLKELETKKHVDPLTENYQRRVNDEIDHCKQRLDQLEDCNDRPPIHNEPQEKTRDGVDAMIDYVCKGDDKQLRNYDQKALSAGSGTDGGYTVPMSFAERIIKHIYQKNCLRPIARVQSVSKGNYQVLQQVGQVEFGWVTETAERPDTKNFTIDKENILAHEIYASPKTTQTLLEDSAVDIESWLVESVGHSFAQAEEKAMLLGDGKNKPHGLLAETSGKSAHGIEEKTTDKTSELEVEDLFNLMSSVTSQYADELSFVMHRDTLYKIRQLTVLGQDNVLWQQSTEVKKPDLLLGRPVVTSDHMPLVESGKIPIVLGNFKQGYLVIDRKGITMMRDPYTNRPYVTFYFTKRVGGGVVDANAFKILRMKK